jgi:hypothetical protein
MLIIELSTAKVINNSSQANYKLTASSGKRDPHVPKFAGEYGEDKAEGGVTCLRRISHTLRIFLGKLKNQTWRHSPDITVL